MNYVKVKAAGINCTISTTTQTQNAQVKLLSCSTVLIASLWLMYVVNVERLEMHNPKITIAVRELNQKCQAFLESGELKLTDEQYALLVRLTIEIESACTWAETLDEWSN